jgi:phasin family protein
MVNDIKAFTQPVTKLVELNTKHFDDLMSTQQKAVDDYQALVKQRIQTASEIRDPVALAGFVTDQLSLAQSGYEKMIANNHSMFTVMQDYNSQVIKLFQESTKQLKKDVRKEQNLIDKRYNP